MACVTTATTTELVATTVAATVTGFICCRINLFAGKCCAYAVCVVQILQRKCAGAKKKEFVKEFGEYGSGEGEFDCLAGVAVNRIGQYIIADR